MVQGARSLKKKLVALAKSESRGQLMRNELTDAKKPNQAGIRSTVLPADLLGDDTTRVLPDLWVPGFLIRCVSSPSATNLQPCQTLLIAQQHSCAGFLFAAGIKGIGTGRVREN